MADVLIVDRWADLISRVLATKIPNHEFYAVENDDKLKFIMQHLTKERMRLALIILSYERGVGKDGQHYKIGPRVAEEIRSQFPSVTIYGYNPGWTNELVNKFNLAGFTIQRDIMLKYITQYLAEVG